MISINNNEKIKFLSKKYDRFSFDKILGTETEIEIQEDLLDRLKKFEQSGLLELKWVIFCPNCGADLKHFSKSMKYKNLKCEFCEKNSIIDPNVNVKLMVYLTKRGKNFFRGKGEKNYLEAI